MTPGFLISAPATGTGKTTVALALMRAFRDRGLSVQPFKCGPDYIDPAFHTAASGRDSLNLDSWAMEPAMLAGHLATASGADVTIGEGAMGLFDGVARPGASGTGASADIAAMTGWPVILVLDVGGQTQSAAAVARGFASHRDGVFLAGVILNRVASPRHEALVHVGMEAAGIPVLGALPRAPDLTLPERHLGLVQAGEQAGLDDHLCALARFMEEHADLDAIQGVAQPTKGIGDMAPIAPPGQRIALAQDQAFSFTYPHLLDGWRKAGAEILPFSPLADEAPDSSADVAWLPGGYPELHGPPLANAETFKSGLRTFAETRPVHGECGGYMVLGAGLTCKEGTRHEMAGLLGLETSFAKRKLHLGYRKAQLLAPIPGACQGTSLRGHEFHYATISDQPDSPLADVTDANGDPVPETGSRRGHVTGSFFHMIAGAA